MGTPVALGALAGVLAVAAPRILGRRSWLHDAPKLGIAAWVSACGAFVLAVVGAGVTTTAPTHLLVHELHNLFHACATAVADIHAGASGRAVAVAGITAAGVAAGAAAIGVTRSVWRGRCEHARHRLAAELVGRTTSVPGVVCVDVDEPAVYCLPGRPGQVVLTRGAVRALERRELAAALAHEREHLRSRHHVLLAVADGLARALPFVPLLRSARGELRYLVEVAADDAAVRRHGRRPLARAIATVAASAVPGRALGAGATDVVTRLARLTAPHRPPSRRTRAAVVVGCSALVLLPVAATGGTLWRAAVEDHCAHPLVAATSAPGAGDHTHGH